MGVTNAKAVLGGCVGKTSPGIKVRTRRVGDFPICKPNITNIILSYYLDLCQKAGLAHTSLWVDELPNSLNHQYTKRVVSGGSSGHRIQMFLNKNIVDFRQLMAIAARAQNFKWKPTGITAVVIFFESPLWITKARTIREMDVDNKVKAVLDAIEKVSESSDHCHWDIHAFKISSKRKRTTVCLFDLGDIVDQFE